VSLIPLIELGHGILHSFNNPFHHHQIRKSRNLESHSLADHHFPKMKFAHEMEEAPSTNFMVLAYVFFHVQVEYKFSNNSFFLVHNTVVLEHYCSVYFCPPTPPPLSTSLL